MDMVVVVLSLCYKVHVNEHKYVLNDFIHLLVKMKQHWKQLLSVTLQYSQRLIEWPRVKTHAHIL